MLDHQGAFALLALTLLTTTTGGKSIGRFYNHPKYMSYITGGSQPTFEVKMFVPACVYADSIVCFNGPIFCYPARLIIQ